MGVSRVSCPFISTDTLWSHTCPHAGGRSQPEEGLALALRAGLDCPPHSASFLEIRPSAGHSGSAAWFCTMQQGLRGHPRGGRGRSDSCSLPSAQASPPSTQVEGCRVFSDDLPNTQLPGEPRFALGHLWWLVTSLPTPRQAPGAGAVSFCLVKETEFWWDPFTQVAKLVMWCFPV